MAKRKSGRPRPNRRHGFYILIMILGWFVPPLAVAVRFGIGKDFFINVLLTIAGYIPGHVHNFFLQNIRNNKSKARSPRWAVKAGLIKDHSKDRHGRSGWAHRYDERVPGAEYGPGSTSGYSGGKNGGGRLGKADDSSAAYRMADNGLGTAYERQDEIVDPVTGETRPPPAQDGAQQRRDSVSSSSASRRAAPLPLDIEEEERGQQDTTDGVHRVRTRESVASITTSGSQTSNRSARYADRYGSELPGMGDRRVKGGKKIKKISRGEAVGRTTSSAAVDNFDGQAFGAQDLGRSVDKEFGVGSGKGNGATGTFGSGGPGTFGQRRGNTGDGLGDQSIQNAQGRQEGEDEFAHEF